MQAATALDHWRGSFGDEYTGRQADSVNARREAWRELLPEDLIDSILEVGCNAGQNLEALGVLTCARLYGVDPNEAALKQAADKALVISTMVATADRLPCPKASMDLVITCGVLIHVPPDKLEQSMREIHRVSKRWIICGEYFAPKEEEIEYRGQSGLMWRRDYGSLYLDLFPDLKCVKTLFAWKRTSGLDNLLFHVLEKV